jgi:hypothetical protein
MIETLAPRQHRIAVPNHAALKIGTLNGILRAVAAQKQCSREAILDTLR